MECESVGIGFCITHDSVHGCADSAVCNTECEIMGLSSVRIRGWAFVSEFLDRPHAVVRLRFGLWNLCSCSADSGPCAFSGPRCSVLWIVVVRSSHCLRHLNLHNAPSCKKGGVETGFVESGSVCRVSVVLMSPVDRGIMEYAILDHVWKPCTLRSPRLRNL